MTSGGIDSAPGRPWWRRPVGIEAIAVSAFVALGPLFARLLLTVFASPLRGTGVASLVADLEGGNPFTDVGWEVASARGLVDPAHSMYETIDILARLIGMAAYDVGSHTHPPTSIVMWIPLGFVPYWLWLPFYVCVALAACAVSLRLMRVPAWLAYPLAALLALTPTGTFALTTTYPVMALALALAWRYRDRSTVAGPAYAVLAAARGVGGVLLLYPVLRRQWRTLVVAVAVLAGVGLVALALEPSAVAEFFRRGAGAVDALSQQPNVFSPAAILGRHGWPAWPAYVVAVAITAIAVIVRRNAFWGLFWLSLAITPLGWVHSLVGALPFYVVIWRTGRLGVLIVLTNVVLALGVLPMSPAAINASWLLLVVTGAAAILAFRLDEDGGRLLPARSGQPRARPESSCEGMP